MRTQHGAWFRLCVGVLGCGSGTGDGASANGGAAGTSGVGGALVTHAGGAGAGGAGMASGGTSAGALVAPARHHAGASDDPRWDDDAIGDLKQITGDAFEVVDTGPIQTY